MRAFVYIIIFFAFFDLFTQLPIMSPFAQSLGANSFFIGMIVGMYSLSNTIGNISSGFLTDKKGPFHILLLGLFSTPIALFLYCFANDPWVLLGIRFIHGLAAGLIVPAAFTFLANATTVNKKGKSSAISGAFVGLAAIIGPAFSGIVAGRTSERLVFVLTGLFILLLALIASFVLRPTTVHAKTKVESDPLPKPMLFSNPTLLKAFAGAFFLMFSQGVIAYLLPLKALEMGGDTRSSGLLLSTFGLIAVLIFILPSNRLFDKIKPINTLGFGMMLMGLSLILLSLAAQLHTLYYIMGCYGIGFAFLFPAINSLLIEATPEHARGKAYGYFYAFFSFGVIVGSFVTGLISLTVNIGFLFTGSLLILASFIIRFTKN